jgi:hypothetical protein
MSDNASKEPSILIDVHAGSTSESWLVVYADGRIKYHVENEGHRVMRYGTEPHDEWIDMDQVAELDQRHHGKQLVEKVQAALKDLREAGNA